MIKKSKIFMMAFASIVLLGACGTENNGTTESSASSEVVSVSEDSSSQEVTAEATYQKMYDDSLAQFEAGKLDEAAGSIDTLLQNDLTEYSELEAKATELKTKINSAQAEKAKADESAALIEQSAYKTERTSDLAATEFKEATGHDIKTVSDDEIQAWLTEKEAAAEQSSSTAASSEAATSSSAASSTSEAPVMTAEEERTEVLNKVVSMTGISAEGNQFYVSKIDEGTYQIEIRHAHEVDGVEISNMVGMFQYNLSDEILLKMDPLNGEYVPYTN